MVHSSHSFFLNYFQKLEFNVFVWNYRGYGLSTGTPTPSNLKSDIDLILKYLKTDLNISGKIGVYGRSLGGIPSSHLS
jgi:pimeloyl-ACP methyl ester carboxylesterase